MPIIRHAAAGRQMSACKRSPDIRARRILLGSFGVASMAMAFSGCTSGKAPMAPEPEEAASPASRPSVLLVTVDTLRFDRLSPGGPMPRLRQLASRGIAFTHAHALVPLTLPS